MTCELVAPFSVAVVVARSLDRSLLLSTFSALFSRKLTAISRLVTVMTNSLSRSLTVGSYFAETVPQVG